MGTSTSKPPPPVAVPASKAPNQNAPAPKPAAKKPAAPKISEADAALLALKVQRNNLFDAAERNENVRARLVAEAKTALALSMGRVVEEAAEGSSSQLFDGSKLTESERSRQKQKALALMRRAKHHETQVQTIQAMFDNIDTTIDALEAGEVQKRVVAALETGKNQLQRLNHNLREADKIMDDMREALADAQEITEHLTAPLDALKAETENEEAEAELAKLMGLTTTKTTTAKSTSVVSPARVPKTRTDVVEPAPQGSEDVSGLKVPTSALVSPASTDAAAVSDENQEQEEKEEEGNTTRQMVAA